MEPPFPDLPPRANVPFLCTGKVDGTSNQSAVAQKTLSFTSSNLQTQLTNRPSRSSSENYSFDVPRLPDRGALSHDPSVAAIRDTVRQRRLARAMSRIVRPGSAAAARLARDDDAWWERLSVADRVRLAFQLSVEQWRLHGWREEESRGRLSRSVTRVRRPRRPVSRDGSNQRATGRLKDRADAERLQSAKRPRRS